ncbi:SDR family NAD(P)-dependent oxidoreductase [Allorhizocola rhizosphaerae]|uniref:SDR family NAD(P)-dependent oxidoreductase n=1 Tax=Allorhizocola rhizosphaerae TaxID=1872709 RepID=UPI000E3E75E0|nr:SDR family oxidoreductase [Allorhizocola rhizosphaerae]
MPNAIITGGSRGLGLALTRVLVDAGWTVATDARGSLADSPAQVKVVGDVTDPAHRQRLTGSLDSIDLLVNNAGALGPSPLPLVSALDADALRGLFETNVVAPLALTQLALPKLRASGGIVINVTSDAAVEPYRGWGGYGASKSALERLGAVLGVEEEGSISVWQLDPGDLRTTMHQDAYPGEDISDRPLPESVAPALLRMLAERPASGRYPLSKWV